MDRAFSMFQIEQVSINITLLDIAILFITYFVFELNSGILSQLKELKTEYGKLKIDQEFFKKNFMTLYIKTRIDTVRNMVILHFVSFSLVITTYFFSISFFTPSAIIFATFTILNLFVDNNDIPLYKSTIYIENIQQLIQIWEIEKKDEKQILKLYNTFSDKSLDKKQRDSALREILDMLP